MKSQGMEYCIKNSCKCYNLSDDKNLIEFVDHLQVWVDITYSDQLESWRKYLIDDMRFKFKNRKNVFQMVHQHNYMNDLVEHIKILDLDTYNIV